jgi:aconitate hydratase
MAPDPNAGYDETMELDLVALEPLIALPGSPDNVVPVREVEGTPVAQVCVGSCNNSSFRDLAVAAAVLQGGRVHPGVSLAVTPGSRQALQTAARHGVLAALIDAGARVLESACGPCIGMGQAPPTDGVSVRTFNRNFPGRSGTPSDRVYLASPEVAAAAALKGAITDPRRLEPPAPAPEPEELLVDDSMLLAPPPAEEAAQVQLLRGPNIKPLPLSRPPDDSLSGRVLLKVGDNVTTDHILPAGAQVLPLRSNIPAIAEHVFARVDREFVRRCKEWGGGIVVGGHNYGQGSSREHAALAPMYLGLRAVVAKSFARIHWTNLVNFGVLPLTLADEKDYEGLEQGDELEVPGLRAAVQGGPRVTLHNKTKGTSVPCTHGLSPRQVQVWLAGGLLNFVKGQAGLA